MKIYLDVDGVLLKHDGTLACHADEFLPMMVRSGHSIQLAYTRRRGGDAAPVVEVLSRLVQPSVAELLPSIRPTSQATSELEAVELARPF
jgi:hypothetical protein